MREGSRHRPREPELAFGGYIRIFAALSTLKHIMYAIEITDLNRWFRPRTELAAPSARVVGRTIRDLLGTGSGGRTDSDGVRRARSAVVHALRDVNLAVEPGTAVCLVGASGSGKSTLLSVLAGALPPTSGRIIVRGRLVSLLSPGENLVGENTAVENIEQERRLRQLPTSKSAEVVQRVLEFAGLDGKGRIPVRTFSSGMQLRLSVGIALQSEADIIVLDDVFGVGDLEFQNTCVEALQAQKFAGKTIVMACSNDDLVLSIADRIIEMRGGNALERNSSGGLFHSQGMLARSYNIEIARHLPESDFVALQSVDARISRGTLEGDMLVIDSEFDVRAESLRLRPAVDLMSGKTVVFRSLFPRYISYEGPQRVCYSAYVPLRWLCGGSYAISVNASGFIGDAPCSLKAQQALRLDIGGTAPRPQGIAEGHVSPDLLWDCERLEERA